MLDIKGNLLLFQQMRRNICFKVYNSSNKMMRVKKTHYQKITDNEISKLSTDIKNFVIKMKNEVKEKDKIFNEYAKIINET